VVSAYAWETEEQRLEVHLNRLGVDCMVYSGVGLGQHPEVRQRAWEEHPPGERYPLIPRATSTPEADPP